MNSKQLILLILLFYIFPADAGSLVLGNGLYYEKWDGTYHSFSDLNITTGNWPYLLQENDTHYSITKNDDTLHLPKIFGNYTFNPNRISFSFDVTPAQLNDRSNADSPNWYIRLPNALKKTRFLWDNVKPTIINETGFSLDESNYWYDTNNGLRFYYNQNARNFGINSQIITFQFNSWTVEGSIGGDGWTNTTVDSNTKIKQCSGGITLQDVVSDYIGKWDLCSGSGNLAPDENTTSNNDGTISNGAWNTSGGLDFNGASTLINMGSDSELDDITSKTIIMDFFLRGWGENGVGMILQKSVWSPRIRNVTENFNFYHGFSTNAGVWKWGTTKFILGTRYQGAMSYVNSNTANMPVIIFKNTTMWKNQSVYTSDPGDVPVGTRTSDASHNLAIGDGVSYTFNGTIYSVTLFNRILNETQINQSINSNKSHKGNITILYDSETGNKVSNITVNVTTPTNTNYSVYYANSVTDVYSLLGNTYTGNNTINITGNRYQNTSFKVELYGNGSATPEIIAATINSGSNSAPTTPTVTSPANATIHYNNTINFTWGITDADGDTVYKQYQLSNDSGFSTIVTDFNTTNLFSGNLSTTEGSWYYFRVRGYDNITWGPWSNILYVFENTAPTVINITLSPATPTNTSNLSVTMFGSDADSHAITPYFLWYLNGTLNNSWNNLTYINQSGNFSFNQTIHVKGYYNDGNENSSQVQSASVIIGTGTSSPSITNISLNPDTRKYNKTIYINATNVSDANLDNVKLQVYYYNNSNRTYLVNSSFYASGSNISVNFTNPWRDGLNHTIYANAIENTSLESTEHIEAFESDIAAPQYLNGSLSSSSVYTTDIVIIYVNASCTQTTGYSDCTISNISLKVLNPSDSYGVGDDGTGNRTMTLVNDTAWIYSYTPTSLSGTYSVNNLYITDDSGIILSTDASLNFSVSSGSVYTVSGGGGGGLPIVTTTQKAIDLQSLLKLKNLTDTISPSLMAKISECYTKDLLLKSDCAESIIFTEPINWISAIIGSLLGSFLILLFLRIIKRDTRPILSDVLLFGLISFILVQLLVVVGINAYFLNFLLQSNLPGYLFISFIIWGMIWTYAINIIIKPK